MAEKQDFFINFVMYYSIGIHAYDTHLKPFAPFKWIRKAIRNQRVMDHFISSILPLPLPILKKQYHGYDKGNHFRIWFFNEKSPRI